MAYSTIQPKIGICKDCSDGSKKPLIAGRCQYHYKTYRSKISLEKRKQKEPEIPNNDNKELGQWYLERRKEMSGFCLNCKKRSCKDNDKFWKWSIAHILPKSIFKSINTHKNNWIELCIDCHTEYDRNWEDASNMLVFIHAEQRFRLFKDQIAQEEKRRIPEQFLI